MAALLYCAECQCRIRTYANRARYAAIDLLDSFGIRQPRRLIAAARTDHGRAYHASNGGTHVWVRCTLGPLTAAHRIGGAQPRIEMRKIETFAINVCRADIGLIPAPVCVGEQRGVTCGGAAVLR